MPKKIYDIKPPRLVTVQKTEAVKVFKKNSVTTKRKKKTSVKENSKILWWRIGVVSILIVLAIVAVYLFFKLPKAEITLWPKVENVSYAKIITADKLANGINILNNIIPASVLQTDKTITQTFMATGSASNDGLASGTIIVYNKYDPVRSFTFKAGTHFMSDSGKLFKAPEKIIIPAAKKVGSKITPGSVVVKVQAVEAGESYNIAPASFSVPALKGTSYYYSIYAVSTEAMSGGYTGKVKKVTSDDIQQAKDTISSKAQSDVMEELRKQITDEYILLNGALISEVPNVVTQTKTGAIVDNFQYQATANATAIVFKKADLEKFAKEFIVSKLEEGKTILEDQLKMEYTLSQIDTKAGKVSLVFNFSCGNYKTIDTNSAALSLLGANKIQVNEIITKTFPDQITKVQVKFWPFWVYSAPKNQKAVSVDLQF
jgi:hypothetical protein